MGLNKLIKDLESQQNKKQAEILQRFFKTGKGQYGEGDIFMGIKVPVQRSICKKYDLDLKDIQTLLYSKIHEHRLCGLFSLVTKYKKHKRLRKKIFKFYLKNSKNINNWDLVDLSAPNIVGDYLLDKEDKRILYLLAKSKNLWEKRIAIVSTAAFIKNYKFADTLEIVEILLKDKHDLIHKAVGWMLREVGKRDVKLLENFLKKHYKEMPRTMLRYAIEKFPNIKRKKILSGKWI